MKIRPEGAELFHEDGWKDGRTYTQKHTTKLIVAFRKFSNALTFDCLLNVYQTKTTGTIISLPFIRSMLQNLQAIRDDLDNALELKKPNWNISGSRGRFCDSKLQ